MLQTSSQTEREVVSAIWQNIEKLMTSGSSVNACLQHLATALPDVDMLETQELSRLAQLHTSSASNLMATIKLLVPSAFPKGSSSPDMVALFEANCNALALVTNVIDVQLFHLHRAAILTAHARQRMGQQALTAAHTEGGSCATNSAA